MIERYIIFAASIANIYKHLQKLERREMEHYGLKGADGQCLLAVAMHPEGITAAQLCHTCEKDKAAISRSLAELERLNFLHREPGYRAPLTLTEPGRDAVHEIAKTVKASVERAGLGMDRERRLMFYEMLNEISLNLEMVCEEGVNTDERETDNRFDR